MKGNVYQFKSSLNWEKDGNTKEKGGSSLPISLLSKGLDKNKKALNLINLAMKDMFETQSLLFDLIQSHFMGGKSISIKSYPNNIGILGFSNGKPA